MNEKELRNESEMLLDPERVARGLGVGIREAIIRHKKLGQSVATMKNGKAVLIPAEEIEIIDESQSSKKT